MTAGRRSARQSLRAKARYRFDNALARGPMIVILYMTAFVLLFVAFCGLIGALFSLGFNGAHESVVEQMYQAFLRMLDPGTFSGDTAWGLRALTVIVTIVGIIFGGSLIGLIASGVDQRVEELNRGRGAVIKTGHSLILGWSAAVRWRPRRSRGRARPAPAPSTPWSSGGASSGPSCSSSSTSSSPRGRRSSCRSTPTSSTRRRSRARRW